MAQWTVRGDHNFGGTVDSVTGPRSWCAPIGHLPTNWLFSVQHQSTMGNRESAPSEEPVGDSKLQHYAQLFRDLTAAPDHSGHPIDDKIFRVSGKIYFLIHHPIYHLHKASW